MNNYLNTNKEAWNGKVTVHANSQFYKLDAFLQGESSLPTLDLDLLGDIKGKKILHLQCHFGMDTISLARLGAKVVGIDFSDKAIRKAEELRNSLNIDADFICCDIYTLPDFINEQFDIIYTSYGVINWLPDLDKWGKVISSLLHPEGKFVMVEFHPVLWMFDIKFQKIESPYSREKPFVTVSETYTDSSEKLLYEEVTWNHGLSKIFKGLLYNNIQITDFEEYDYSPVNLFGNMTEEDGVFRIPSMEQLLPILFSIVAQKQK